MSKLKSPINAFLFRGDKSLFWPERSTLIVADLHLEKGSWYAGTGQFLPPYDTTSTLKKLDRAVTETGARKIIALGDNFHDSDGPKRLHKDDKTDLDRIRQKCEVIWVLGNHDPDLCLSTDYGDKYVDKYKDIFCDFCHIAGTSMDPKRIEISGHYHPKASLRSHGRKISGPCFIYSGHRLIMPSFGTYTGGLDIQAAEIQSHFNDEYEITICWKGKTYNFSKQTYLRNIA